MAIKLDLKDRKILYELDRDSRQPLSAVAKKVGLSKQTTTNRVRGLEQEGIIQKYLAIMDISKLGYSGYKVLIRIQSADKEKRIEITEFVKNHPNVEFASSTDGNFDINFNIFARNIEELDSQMREFQNKYGKFTSERQIMPLLIGKFYPRAYLIGSKDREGGKLQHFGIRKENEELPKLDEKDRKILGFLGQDARAAVSGMAKSLLLSHDAVRLRIKKLEKLGIIQSYALVLDCPKIGRMNYKVLFRLENLEDKRLISFEEYWSRHPNIWFSSRAVGPWEEEINVDVADPSEFRDIMNEIKEKFSGIVRDYTVLSMYSIDKFNFYPFEEYGRKKN
jgi:Lrp/AsnC family leucine-responsive transcriptional regulator